MKNKLTPEQIEKIKECKNMEELKKLVQTENIELNDEELDEVVGGSMPLTLQRNVYTAYTCTTCGYVIAESNYKPGKTPGILCPTCHSNTWVFSRAEIKGNLAPAATFDGLFNKK